MYNLIRFIKLNQFLLFFLLIEIISISLLVQNNSYQANKIINFSTKYTSIIYDYSNYLREYLVLKETNNYLKEENAKLHTLLQNKENNIDSCFTINKKFNYIAAKVINNSIKKRNNYITLNKGYKDGIQNGMGVITNNGVIGVIHSVSNNYSIVISLLHKKSSAGIFLKKNMHTGILTWKGFDYRTATINDFPIHISLNHGDTIITNSYSNIYPEGINIGSITNFHKTEYGFYKVDIKLFEDFNKLRYVYVVNSKQSNEQIQLEKKVKKNE